MSVDRIKRINELLKREIGQVLFTVVDEDSFDHTAVSVTHVAVARDLRQARVYVSIRDHESERERMLGLLRKHRAEIQARIGSDLELRYTPRLSFELDLSVEKGDRVLGILSELDVPEEEQPPPAPEPPENET